MYKFCVHVPTFDKQQCHHIIDNERISQQYVDYLRNEKNKKQYQSYYQISSYRRAPSHHSIIPRPIIVRCVTK